MSYGSDAFSFLILHSGHPHVCGEYSCDTATPSAIAERCIEHLPIVSGNVSRDSEFGFDLTTSSALLHSIAR